MSRKPAVLDRLLRADEAARELGVCERTLKRLGQRGQLDVVHAGARALRYRQSDVARLQKNGWGE